MRSRTVRWPLVALAVAIAAIAGCSGTKSADQPARSVGTPAPVEAAKGTFCEDLGSYLQVIDRYGRVFNEAPLTVGQLQSAEGELAAAHDKVVASGGALADSITAANKASAASDGTGSTTTTVLQTQTADEHVAAITLAEKNFDRTTAGIDASTTVQAAATDVQAAAFGVEQAYVSLFVDAGCLAEQASASRAVDAYVKGLQQDLTTLGYYTGQVDGLYGPDMVAAIKALQKSAGLPDTGIVDPATEAALNQQLAAKGAQQSRNIAAIQGALTASGHYTGPIDGQWTPATEDAVKSYQQSQGLPATGALDPATLAALLQKDNAPTGPTTTVANATPSTAATSTTSTPAAPTTTKAPTTTTTP